MNFLGKMISGTMSAVVGVGSLFAIGSMFWEQYGAKIISGFNTALQYIN